MNIETLREFLCLSENLNFTATARQCFVTQSVLSKHISNLEKELGVVLFVRDRQRVRLTSTGDRFAKSVREMLSVYDEAIRNIDRDEKAGVLRVAFLSGATKAFIYRAYENFLACNSEVDVVLRTMEGSDLCHAIEDNEADIAIKMVYGDVNASWYSSYKIFDDFYGIVVSADHKLAQFEEVTKNELAGVALSIPSRARYEEEWLFFKKSLGRAMQNVVPFDDVNDIVDFGVMPLSGDRVLIAPSHIGCGLDKSRLKFIPLVDPYLKMNICAVWKTRAGNNPLIQGFISSIKEVTENMGTDVLRGKVGVSFPEE